MILNRVEMIVVAPDFPYVVGAGVLGSWLAVVWHGEDTSFYLGCVLITDRSSHLLEIFPDIQLVLEERPNCWAWPPGSCLMVCPLLRPYSPPSLPCSLLQSPWLSLGASGATRFLLPRGASEPSLLAWDTPSFYLPLSSLLCLATHSPAFRFLLTHLFPRNTSLHTCTGEALALNDHMAQCSLQQNPCPSCGCGYGLLRGCSHSSPWDPETCGCSVLCTFATTKPRTSPCNWTNRRQSCGTFHKDKRWSMIFQLSFITLLLWMCGCVFG